MFLLLTVLPALPALAQGGHSPPASKQQLQFEHLNRENGLPSNSIKVVFQDSRGFLWFGTRGGLVRYDGYELKVYKNDPNDPQSIRSNEVTAIYEDRDERLWVGTALGLNRFDRLTETFKHYIHRPEDSLSISHNRISSIYEDQQGLFWIGTRDGGLNLMDRKKETFVHYLPDPDGKYGFISNSISAIAETDAQAGTLQLGTRFNLDIHVQFNTATRTFDYYPGSPQEGKSHPYHGDINAIIESKTSGLWLATSFGLDFLPPGNKTGISYQHHSGDSTSLSGYNVTAIFEDARQNLWVGTRRNGLNLLPKASSSFYHYRHDAAAARSLASDNISAIFEDRSGVLWIGTDNAGISYADPKQQKFKYFKPYANRHKNQTYKYYISTIYEDSEQVLWIGSHFEGLQYYDKTNNTFRHVQDESGELQLLSELRIWSIHEDQQGMLWLGTNRDGLYRFDRKKGSLKTYKNNPEDPYSLASNYVPDVIESRDGTLWIATTNGLQQLDRETDRFQTIPLGENGAKNSPVDVLQEDQLGNMWGATASRLFCLNPETGSIRYFNADQDDPNSLSGNVIYCIAEDGFGNIWAGTRKGLFKFCIHGVDQPASDPIRIIQYTEIDGLSSNQIAGILEDGRGQLWISTDNGLSRFSNPQHKDQSSPDFKQFGLKYGLQGYEFTSNASFKNSVGELYFGGPFGFNRFHPDSITTNSFLPPVVITSFTSFDLDAPEQEAVAMKGISEKEELTLSYENNIFSIGFAAFNYRQGYKNEYTYQLEGFNKYWIPLGTAHQVTFTNLDPGTYTFRVKGANNDGIWDETPTELKITITPPWWKTNWAYLLYVMSFLTVLYLWRRYELNRRQLKYDLKIEQMWAEQKHQEAEQLKELDQFKSRFFTNITHEFRTPLTVILGMNEQLSMGSEQPGVKGQRNLIKRNGENLLRLINQLLDLAKLESNSLQVNLKQGDVLPYLRYISESLHSLANFQNVFIRVESDERTIMMDYDSDRLLQIVYNLLSNAIKFSPSGGRVLLRAEVASTEDGPRLMLSVTDNGMGIPSKDLPHIFDRFYQAGNLDNAKAGGTGIGLALTKELVGMLGGNISVTSELGKETTFLVDLPITNKAELLDTSLGMSSITTNQGVLSPEVLPDVTDTLPSSGYSLLIIEDNPDVVEYLTACLQGSYTLDFAYNGRIGIEKALEAIPDLIVSDVMMPEKDGFEVTDTLKNDERTSHIPIVLLTARGDIESRLTGLRRGADAYLSKPFNQEVLMVTLAKLLELRKKLQAKYRNVIRVDLAENAGAEGVKEDPGIDYEDAFLQNVISHVEIHLDSSDYSVPQLSHDLGLSQSQLYRKIKALTDLSTVAFVRRFRLHKGKYLLETTDLTISEIAYRVGFATLSYFSDAFYEEFGLRPNAMRK